MTPFSDGFEHSFTMAVHQTSASFWRKALLLCLSRIEAGQKLLVPFDIENVDLASIAMRQAVSFQQAADVHFALVSLRNTLRVMEDELKKDNDASLAALEADFRERFPDAWDLRDILEHLLDYEKGKGNLQIRGEMPTDESIPNLIYGSVNDPDAEVVLLFNFDTRHIRIKEALRKAVEIADRLSELEQGGRSSA